MPELAWRNIKKNNWFSGTNLTDNSKVRKLAITTKVSPKRARL